MELYSEYLENFHLLDVGKYFKRPAWGPGEGIDLSVGQPDFEVPLRVRHAAAEAVLRGPGGYVSSYGFPALRDKLAALHGRSAGEMLVTSGSSAGLFMAMRVLLQPGDEVVIFDPYFAGYKACAQLVGASIRFVQTDANHIPNLVDVAAAVSSRTKLMIINTPNNPTGAVYPRGIIQGLAAIAAKHKFIVISDEVYDTFVYDGEHVPFADYYDGTITLKSLSKSYGMTGWRIGYAYGPGEIIRNMALVNQYIFACVPPFIQTAAITALDMEMNEPESYRRKRDLLYDGIKDRYCVVKPHGAYYALVETPIPETAFVEQLLAHKMIVFPGKIFSETEGRIRISFAASDQILTNAIEILNRVYGLSF